VKKSNVRTSDSASEKDFFVSKGSVIPSSKKFSMRFYRSI
jgi:hypothetical protein